MFGSIGTTELILILVIVLLIFGVGRLPEVFKALGSGVKEFRDAAGGEDDDEKSKEETEKKETDEPTESGS